MDTTNWIQSKHQRGGFNITKQALTNTILGSYTQSDRDRETTLESVPISLICEIETKFCHDIENAWKDWVMHVAACSKKISALHRLNYAMGYESNSKKEGKCRKRLRGGYGGTHLPHVQGTENVYD